MWLGSNIWQGPFAFGAATPAFGQEGVHVRETVGAGNLGGGLWCLGFPGVRWQSKLTWHVYC